MSWPEPRPSSPSTGPPQPGALTRPHPLPGRLLTLAILALAIHAQHADPAEEPARPPPALDLLEAVGFTLAQDPQIAIQTLEAEASQGRALAAAGAFDVRLTTSVAGGLEQTPVRSSLPGPGNFERLLTQRLTAQIGLQQLLRNGIELGPQLQITRLDDNLSNYPPENRAEVRFSVRVPLARGRGARDTAAEEQAATLEAQASRLQLRFTHSARVLTTAAAYWSYAAAAQRADIRRQAEDQIRDQLEKTHRLVQAEEVPAADLDQLTANLEDKSAGRIRSDQELIEARYELAVAMGWPADRMATLGLPITPFPSVPTIPDPLPTPPPTLDTEAVHRREDLRAARLSADAARVLREGARSRTRPRLDLILQAGYGGVSEGNEVRQFFSSYYENVEGINALGGLSFEFPPANRTARGQLAERDALYRQNLVRSDNLERTIRASVQVAWQRVQHTLRELQRSAAAVTHHQRAVLHERQKRQLGLATFNDVILVEDRLLSAALSLADAQRAYATAIAQLRHEAGLLILGDPALGSVTLDQLVTVPTEPYPPVRPADPEAASPP